MMLDFQRRLHFDLEIGLLMILAGTSSEIIVKIGEMQCAASCSEVLIF